MSTSKPNNASGRRKNQRPRGHSQRSGGGGPKPSAGQRRREFTRMPRVKPKPSLWQRFLAVFGLGGAKKSAVTNGANPAKPKQAPKSEASSERRTRPSAARPDRKTARPERRSPVAVEVTSGRLYVGNLSYDASEADLEQLFSGVGSVTSAEVIYNKRTQRSKGYGFVELLSVDQAKRAVRELHDKDYMGRRLVVSGAKAPETDMAGS